jgi:hypothetical protein
MLKRILFILRMDRHFSFWGVPSANCFFLLGYIIGYSGVLKRNVKSEHASSCDVEHYFGETNNEIF